MTKHWLTCPGIGVDKSGVKPVAKEAVKRDSSHACPTEGLEVGKYMGWGASVASEPTQVAMSLDDSDCGYELLSFSVAWPNYEEPDKNKILWTPVKVRQSLGTTQKRTRTCFGAVQMFAVALATFKKCSAVFRFDW